MKSSKLKYWYSLEMYQDEVKRGKARILLIPILMYWVVSLISLILNLSWGDPLLTNLLVVGSILQLIPLGFLLAKKLTATSYAFVFISILFTTLFASTGQGIHDYVLMVYPAVIIWAGLTGRRPGLFLATLLTLLSFAWLVMGQTYGVFVIQPITPGDWTDVFVASLLVIVSALAVSLLVSNLERALMTTRLELAEHEREEIHNRIIAEVQDFLLHPSEMRDIYSLVSEKTRELIGDGITATSILDEEHGNLLMSSFHGLDIPFEKILTVIGFDPWQKEFPLDAIAEEDLKVYWSGKLGVFEGGLYALMTRTIPKTACLMIEKLLGVEKIYGMGFIHKEAHLGGLVILARNDITPHIPVIEQIVNLATIAIERKRAEDALNQSEARYRRVVETTNEGIYFVDQDVRITLVNQRMAVMLGYTKEELLGKKLESLLFEEDIADHRTQMLLREQGQNAVYERYFRRQDGSRLWTIVSATSILDEHGRVGGSFAMLTDITERRRAEDALRIAEADYRAIFENAPNGVFQSIPAGHFRRVNPAMARIYGYTSPEEMLSSITDIASQIYVNSSDRQGFQSILAENGEVIEFIGENYRKDQTIIWTQTTARTVKDAQGNILWYEGFITDITERRKAEDAVKMRNAELAVLNQIGQKLNKLASPSDILESVFEEIGKILDNRNLYITLYDKERQNIIFQVYTKEGVRQFGVERPLGDGVTDYIIRHNEPVFSGPDMDQTRARLGITRHGKPALSYIGVPIYKDVEVVGVIALQDYERVNVYTDHHLELLTTIAAQVSSALENARLYYEVQEELEERKRAEEALKQSEKNYRELFQVNRDGIAIFGIGPNGRPGTFLELNPAAHNMIGYTREEMLQFTPDQLEQEITPEQASLRQAEIMAHGVTVFETVLRHKDGHPVYVEMTVQIVQYEGRPAVMNIARDISERKQADEALRQSEIRFRSIIENAPIAISIGRDGKLLYANPVYVSMHGFESAAELIGSPTLDRVAPGDREQALSRQTQRSETPALWGAYPNEAQYELTGLRKDGTEIQLLVAVTRINLADGPANIGFIQDITLRKQAEDSLRKSEAKFRAVVEQSNDGILFSDADATVRYRSPSYIRINGFTDEERIGRSGFETVHPDDAPSLRIWWANLLKNQELTQRTEYRIRHKDGSWRWIETSAQNLLGNPDVQSIVVAARDITDRKHAEDALHESEERYRGAITAAGLVPYVIDYSDRRFTFLGENIYKLTGYMAEEFSPDILKESVLENKVWEVDHLGLTLEQLQAKFLSGEIGHWGSDMRIRLRNGEERWISDVSLPQRDEHGKVTSAIGVFQDLTERKRNEETLLRLAAIVESSDDAIIGRTLDGVITSWNGGAETLYGYSASEAIGQPISILSPIGQEDDLAQILNRIKLGERISHFETKRLRKDGRELDVSGSISAIKTSSGRIVGISSIARDITEQKRAEAELLLYREHLEVLVNQRTAELVIAKEQAEAANRAKSDFLAVMSHEIRTPLNGVLGNAQLLGRTGLTEKQRSYLHNLQISGESLLSVISDILDFSKIESGMLQLEEISFSLDAELARLTGNLASRAHEKKLELVFDTAPDIPRHLVGDPARLGQVLLNLVGNAIKFTEVGTVLLKTSLAQRPVSAQQEETSTRALLEFSVKDTGIGLSVDQLGLLFKPFTQADSSTTRKYGGTGLGLSISRRLVQIMGGDIRVESQPGRGSIFTFTLPFALQNPKNEPAKPAEPLPRLPALAGMHLLVVEDNPDALDALRSALEFHNARVSAAYSVEAGLEILAQTDPETPSHMARVGMIFIDLNLRGGLSGLDAVSRMKQSNLSANTPIILMGNAVEVLPLAENLSLDAILSKPFTHSQLIHAISQVLEIEILQPEGDSAGTSLLLNGDNEPAISAEMLEKLRAGHILLVEDNQINRLVASEIMQNMGLEVALANDGETALDMIRSSLAGNLSEQYDAVLMDIQMPGIDGYEATRRIRDEQLENVPHLPIIAMTANAMKGDRKKALDAGMDDYISKPVNVNQLAAVLLRWVKPRMTVRKSVVAAGSYGMEGTHKFSIKPGSSELPAALEGVNMSAALSRLADNKSLYRRLLLLFNVEHANDVRKIRAALQENNLDFARHLTHTLKGVAGTVGADELREAARALEAVIMENTHKFSTEGDAHSYDDQLARLEQKLAVVISSIADIE